MFERIISFSVSNRLFVLIGVLALVVWGITSLQSLPIDAVPDITNNQVQIVTVSPALAPQEVERLITTPVELTMASIPGITEMRSISRFGLSVVTIVFSDNTDVYWARAQADQRLAEVASVIPKGTGTPLVAPLTTGLGEIYQYTIRVKDGYANRYSLAELRTIQDWIIRRRLLGTPGVADVSGFGGDLHQIEIAIDPDRLRSQNLSLADVAAAVERNNANAGGAYIEKGPNVQYIRTEGTVTSAEDVANIVVRTTDNNLPVLVRDVATVRNGRAIRYGALTMNSAGETVGGIVLMLKGANSSEVIDVVKQRIAAIEKSLPEGLTIEPYLDRTRLVNKAINTVAQNLIEGALIVIFVLVLMLGNLRAGLIVASVIPLSMLFAVGMMGVFGVSGNLMSLGAIDFGLIVDGAVIIVESVLHVLQGKRANADSAREAAVGIRRSAAFGEVIIMMVYLPILALVGIEGKMFKPMAQTVIFAIIGAFLLSTTYVPMMASWLLKPGIRTWSAADRVMQLLTWMYVPIRRLALRFRWLTIVSTGFVFVIAVVAFLKMGGEFLPQLDEGDFAIEMRLMTGSSLNETIATAQKAASILQTQFPEVERVIGKIGTSEIPLDPMPMNSGDLIVVLKDKHEWTSATTRENLASKMQKALEAIPGVAFGFQQPIQMRFNELMTGARQDVVVKIFGDNMDTLAMLAGKIGKVADHIAGAADVYVEPVSGLPQVTIRCDRHACASLGVSIEDINATIRAAFAGEQCGLVYEGDRRFDIVVRLDSARRHNPSDVSSLFVPSSTGALIPIEQVATVLVEMGPNQIQRENAQRRIMVGFNVRGRDVESIVTDLESAIAKEVPLPSGYFTTYGGQFENLNAAKERLTIAVPVALLLIFFLLYLTFSSVRIGLLIFSAVPLSAIGGVAALLVRGMPFSISAGVGFIALFGVAVLNGIVLISAFRKLREDGITNPLRIVIVGTQQRLRPVAMTAMVASLGFLPMAISNGDGAEVQRPLATVVIGGLITATMLTLLLLPTLYSLFGVRKRVTTPVLLSASIVACMIAVGAYTPAHAQVPTISRVSLDSALRMATESNIDVQRAKANEQHANAMLGAAVDIGSTSITYMGGQYNSSSYDNNFTITQAVPFPTKLFASRALADNQLQQARLALRLADLRVRLDVVRAYAAICANREIDRILSEHELLLNRALRVAQLREQTGEGTPLERVSAETQRADVLVQRMSTQSAIRSAEIELQILCGSATALTSADTIIPQTRVYQQADSGSTPSAFLLFAQQKVHVAGSEESVASNAYWPDITLGYFNQTLVGTPLAPYQQPATLSNRFSGFMLGVSVPLWFAPTAARVQAAGVRKDAARREANLEQSAYSARQQQVQSELQAARVATEFYRTTGLAEVQFLVQQSQRAYEVGEVGWLEHQSALLRGFSMRMQDVAARRKLFELHLYQEYLNGTL